MDIIAVLTNQNEYSKTQNYWKYLKAKLKKENSQVVSATTKFKFLALEVHSYFRLKEDRAREIIREVKEAVRNWKKVATKYGLSNAERELKSRAFQQTQF